MTHCVRQNVSDDDFVMSTMALLVSWHFMCMEGWKVCLWRLVQKLRRVRPLK